VYTAEVLRTVPVDQPDLFAAAPGGSPPRSQLDLKSVRANGQAAEPKEGGGHA
jgi:hypothetical protein